MVQALAPLLAKKEIIIIAAIVILFVGGGSVWGISKIFSKSKEQKKAEKKEKKQRAESEKKVKKAFEDQLPNFLPVDYENAANSLETNMQGLNGLIAKSEIIKLFGAAKNEKDIILLNDAFGIRDGQDLKTWLENDSIKDDVNEKLFSMGLKITF
jgi:hypothetical protein